MRERCGCTANCSRTGSAPRGPTTPKRCSRRHDIARWTGEAGRRARCCGCTVGYSQIRNASSGLTTPKRCSRATILPAGPARRGSARRALRLYRELLPDRQRVLGPDHPDTLGTRHHIARWTGEAGDAARSAAAVPRIAPGPAARPGARPPRNAAHAPRYCPLDRRDCPLDRRGGGARERRCGCTVRLLPDQECVLGPDHPETLPRATILPAGPARRGTRAERCGCTVGYSQIRNASSGLTTPKRCSRATILPAGPARRDWSAQALRLYPNCSRTGSACSDLITPTR